MCSCATACVCACQCCVDSSSSLHYGCARPALPQNYTSTDYFRGPHYNSSYPSTSGVCVLSNTGRLDALSPTFSVSDGIFVYEKKRTGDYSSWAESRWAAVAVADSRHEGMGCAYE